MLALCDGSDGDTIGSGGHFRGVLQKNSDGELLSQKTHGLLRGSVPHYGSGMPHSFTDDN